MPDLRLTARRHEPPVQRGVLLRLLPSLVGLICSVSVGAILEGTAYGLEDVEVLLKFTEELDWTIPEWLTTDFLS